METDHPWIPTNRDVIRMFIFSIQRSLTRTIPTEIMELITFMFGITVRITTFNESLERSSKIDILNGTTIRNTSRRGMGGTVICGDGIPMNRERAEKQEVVFKINEMDMGLFIGYISSGSAGSVNFEDVLGMKSNKEKSVGIGITRKKFYLFDKEHLREDLNCEAEEGPSSLMKQGQIWRVIWNLDLDKMEIIVMNQQRAWTAMVSIAIGKEHQEIIPAFSLCSHRDSISLLPE